MAKTKRKPSARQRDKNIIHLASVMKKAGIISKQAKLHGGHYVSKEVARKVEQYKASAELGYKAVKVPKKVAQAAKERGFQVVGGNKIIGPSTPTFRNRLKKGELTGVRPIKGGMMEEVILPHTVFDMHTLVEQLQEGIDSLKMPDEKFAFTYKGYQSMRAFLNTKQMLEWLTHYKSAFNENGSLKAEDLTEEFENFTIFRLHPHDERALIPTHTQRIKARKASGEYRRRKQPSASRNERMWNWDEGRRQRALDRMARKDREKREALKKDPQAYEKAKEKARERAKKSYEKRKNKNK